METLMFKADDFLCSSDNWINPSQAFEVANHILEAKLKDKTVVPTEELKAVLDVLDMVHSELVYYPSPRFILVAGARDKLRAYVYGIHPNPKQA